MNLGHYFCSWKNISKGSFVFALLYVDRWVGFGLVWFLFFFFFNDYKSTPGFESPDLYSRILATSLWSAKSFYCSGRETWTAEKKMNFLITSECWNLYILALIRSAGFPINTSLSQILHNFKLFLKRWHFLYYFNGGRFCPWATTSVTIKGYFAGSHQRWRYFPQKDQWSIHCQMQGSEVLALI